MRPKKVVSETRQCSSFPTFPQKRPLCDPGVRRLRSVVRAERLPSSSRKGVQVNRCAETSGNGATAWLAVLATASARRYARALGGLGLTSARAACAGTLSTLTLTILDRVHGMTPGLVKVEKPGWFLERIVASKRVRNLNETAILLFSLKPYRP